MLPALESRTFTNVFQLKRPEGNFKAAICLFRLPASCPFNWIVDVLHSQELEYYNTLKFDRRQRSYLIGRYAAKQAIAALISKDEPRNIFIQQGIFNQPVVIGGGLQNIQVSITHCDEMGAAIAFPESHPMGIDLESMNGNKREVMESQMTEAEKDIMTTSSLPYDTILSLFWTSKEALSKVLKTGLMTPFTIFEMNTVDVQEDRFSGDFRYFAQYKSLGFKIGQHACSIVCPKKTEMGIEGLIKNNWINEK